MRQYSLYRRGKYFYCQFKNPETGKYTSGISTRQTTRDMAIATVVRWELGGKPESSTGTVAERKIAFDTVKKYITSGVTPSEAQRFLDLLQEQGYMSPRAVVANESPLLSDFLSSFWDYETSPYVREEMFHNRAISKRTCYDRRLAIRKYWEPFFSTLRLNEVTKKDLRDLSRAVGEKVKPQTANHVMNAGTIALRWAFENDLTETDPTVGLKKFTVRPEKRGILNEDEARALFHLSWSDERSFVANLLAMTSGMRSGEIAALRVSDLADDVVRVERSWGEQNGFKLPKNGEPRFAPLLPPVREQLVRMAQKNPHGCSESSLVFWSTREPDRPVAPRQFAADLKRSLIALKLGLSSVNAIRETQPDVVQEAAAYWESRNVVFHSWRHYYTTRMATRIEKHKAMIATGHKSSAVFEAYANHDLMNTVHEISLAAQDAFSSVFTGREAS